MRGLVALTGGTGFVGAAIARHLMATGWQVRVLARRLPQSALRPGHVLEIVLGDLDDRSALEALVAGADAIVHCAGLIRALQQLDFFRVNEGGVTHILEAAAKKASSARLIHISSLAAREPELSPYAGSKRAGELKVAALAGSRDWITLRPPVVYGPGDHELLPLFRAAKLGLLAYPALPQCRVSTIHVEDLAAAIPPLLETPAWGGQTIEVDDEHPGGHDWPELIQVLGRCVGKRPVAVRLPRAAMAPIAAGVGLYSAMTGRAQVLSPAKLAEIYHPGWVSAGPRLSGICSWRPSFGLADGFADTCAWYRNEALL